MSYSDTFYQLNAQRCCCPQCRPAIDRYTGGSTASRKRAAVASSPARILAVAATQLFQNLAFCPVGMCYLSTVPFALVYPIPYQKTLKNNNHTLITKTWLPRVARAQPCTMLPTRVTTKGGNDQLLGQCPQKSCAAQVHFQADRGSDCSQCARRRAYRSQRKPSTMHSTISML